MPPIKEREFGIYEVEIILDEKFTEGPCMGMQILWKNNVKTL